MDGPLGRRAYDGAFSDHDMLVRLDAKVDLVLATAARQDAVNAEYARRLDSLEATRDQQLGAFKAGGASVRIVAVIASAASALTTVATFLLAQALRGGAHP